MEVKQRNLKKNYFDRFRIINSGFHISRKLFDAIQFICNVNITNNVYFYKGKYKNTLG